MLFTFDITKCHSLLGNLNPVGKENILDVITCYILSTDMYVLFCSMINMFFSKNLFVW